jgi:hypothetical protein
MDIFNFLSQKENLWNYLETGLLVNTEEEEGEAEENETPNKKNRLQRIKHNLKRDHEHLV